MRLCVGVASVELSEGERIGTKNKVFDFRKKLILSINDYEDMIEKKIARVKIE